jgi:hypothetical protein
MDVVIVAICSGVGGLVSGLAAAWVVVRKNRTELTIKEQDAKAVRDREARAEEDKSRKQERTEYKQLYAEVKAELVRVKEQAQRDLSEAREQDRRCQKQVRRLELAMVGAGIPLPPLSEDDDGSNESEEQRHGGTKP